MYFAHLKRGLTAVIRPKNRLLNPWFGPFNSSALCFYVTKANNFAQPLMAAKFSKAVQSPYSLNTFRSKSFTERRKFTGGVYGLVKELADFLEKVKEMVAAGNKDDAMDLLRAEYEAAMENVNAGTKGIEEAFIIKEVARGYMDSGSLESVGPVMSVLMEIVVGLKDGELLMDLVLVQMGQIYSALGEFDKSVLVYQRGIGILENRHEKNTNMLEAAYLGIAKSLSSLGKAAKAIEFYRYALKSMKSSGGVESGQDMIPSFELAQLLLKEGKGGEAEVHFIRIFNVATKLFGEHDGKVGMTMIGVATAKLANGDSSEAIRLYRNGLQVIENSNFTGLDDSFLERVRVDVAALLYKDGRETESREVLHECLRIFQKNGKEDWSLAKIMFNLGTSYLRSNDYVEAENFSRKSMEILAKVKGPQHKAITMPMLPLAVTLHHLGRYEEAEKLALEALQIRENAFGKDSGHAAEALEVLVLIQSMIIKDDQVVLEKLERLLKIHEKESGYECEQVWGTLGKMAYYLDKLGRKDELLSLEQRLSTLSTKFKSPSKLFDYFWWYD